MLPDFKQKPDIIKTDANAWLLATAMNKWWVYNWPLLHGLTCASLNTSAWLQWHRLLYLVTVIARSFGDLLRYQFLTARRRDRPNLTFCLVTLNWLSNCNSWNSVVVISQRSCNWLFTACLTFISSVASPVSCVVQNATAPISTFIFATFPDLASLTKVLITSSPLLATNRSLSTRIISSSISLLITIDRFRQLRSSSTAIAVLSGMSVAQNNAYRRTQTASVWLKFR